MVSGILQNNNAVRPRKNTWGQSATEYQQPEAPRTRRGGSTWNPDYGPDYIANQGRQLGNDLFGLFSEQIDDAYRLQPEARAAQNRGLAALNPGNVGAMSEALRRRVLAENMKRGRRNATIVGNLGEGAAAGAMLGAENDANVFANEYLMSLMDPTAQAQRSIQAMQLASPSATLSVLPAYSQLAAIGAPNAASYQPDKPTFLESLLGAAAQVPWASFGKSSKK